MLNEQELRTKSLKQLKFMDVDNPEDEVVLQKVMNEKLKRLPPVQKISRSGIPDITNPEEEKRWQAIMDERVRKAKLNLYVADEEPAETEEKPTDKDEETIQDIQNDIEGEFESQPTSSIEDQIQNARESLEDTQENEALLDNESIENANESSSEIVLGEPDVSKFKSEKDLKKLKKQELIDFALSIGLQLDPNFNSLQRVDAILEYQKQYGSN